MKLRNLFLAGIAIVAMASCSNEVDGINNDANNDNAEKSATVRFSIGFPSSTRATTDEGTSEEQSVEKITAVLVYSNGSPIQVLNFEKSELAQNGTNVTTDTKEVYAGSGNVYVYINPINPITENNYSTITASAAYTSTLDGLIDNIAKDNNFLMSGQSTFTAVAGNSGNTATVTVSRVAAKINESSQTAAFTATNNDQLKITLKNYTFTNLNKTSNVLAGTIFKPETTDGYFQYFVRTGAELKTFENLAKKEIGKEDTNVTYCLENENSNATTQVLYEAQAILDENGKAVNLYVVTGGDKAGLYANFNKLNAAYGGQLSTAAYGNLGDGSTYDEFNSYGIKKYTNGICYYAGNITTNNLAKIVRNNIYKLTVTSIAGLGEPGIDIPETGDPITMLNLDITIAPWTVNENSFDLQ